MRTDIPISCSCGQLQAVARAVSGRTGNRLVCYCDDCQAFAGFLGRADEILDRHGGTDIFQLSSAQLEINKGIESLACVRLSPRGVLRWYAGCCKTPIGNTLPTRQIPFVSVICFCMAVGDQSLDELIGPVRAGVNGRYAIGDRAEISAHDKVSLAVRFRVYRKLIGWRLRGDHLRTPFFDDMGAPVVKPQVP